MLDETINYVQALQRQVEVRIIEESKFSLPSVSYFVICTNAVTFQFLSMKLATLNPQLDFSCAQQPLGIPLESMVANGPDVHGYLFG